MELTLRQKQLAALLSISKDGGCIIGEEKFGYIDCSLCVVDCPSFMPSDLKNLRIKEALSKFTDAEILTILILKEASND